MALVATALERSNCRRGSSCPSGPIRRKGSRQRIATHIKKNCHGNSRHRRRRHRRRRYRRHHSRRHGYRRCHCHRRRRCCRRCHRRRWDHCYHCVCKPAVQPGLCLNLWLLFFRTREENRRDGTTWLAGAGREVEEILSAMEHAFEFWNNVERAVVGTGGRVCTIDRGSEHGRKRRRCPKRARVKEKGTAGHQRGLRPAPGTCFFAC